MTRNNQSWCNGGEPQRACRARRPGSPEVQAMRIPRKTMVPQETRGVKMMDGYPAREATPGGAAAPGVRRVQAD